jgi:hypothetical protein
VGYYGRKKINTVAGLYEKRVPIGVELSAFKRPNGILHSARYSLNLL